MADVAGGKHSRVRENISNWEDDVNPLAQLTVHERDTIIELSSVSNVRPLPTGIALANSAANPPCSDLVLSPDPRHGAAKIPDAFSRLQIGDVKLESSQQFLTWFADVEDSMASEQDGVYVDYVAQLTAHRGECQTLLSQLDEALSNLQQLSSQYTSVSNKTSALHTDCEHLLAEQTRLANKADTIEQKLAYFKELDRVGQKLNSPAFQVTSDAFIPLLAKIDECIAYMNTNFDFQESSVFLAKYRHCLSRALGMVKMYVTRSLEAATLQVLPRVVAVSAETATSTAVATTADNAAVLYYSKFRANAPRIKALMAEIEDRASPSSPDYMNLLADCHGCYLAQRSTLMWPCVTDALGQLARQSGKDLCSLVRSGCAFLARVCEDEHALYGHFFGLPTGELDRFLRGLCTGLYDVVRPMVIHVDHLETLAQLCNILRRGMIEEHIQSNPTQLAPLSHIVNQLLEDTQERLVYRAHIYVQTDISGYQPSPGDLAYPAKLLMMESIAESVAGQRKAVHSRNDSVNSISSVRSAASEEVARITNGAHMPSQGVETGERFSRVGTSPADLHGMWYPTVRRTLMCLSKVYRCVDRSIFQGVSLEALSSCMQSLSSASSVISKNSSPLDAQLFEIKHLLILREQMAPFQVDVCLRETSLDWSKMKDAARGLVNKRNRLFSLNSNNSLLEFIVEGTPQVTEHLLDSKRDLDNRLKLLCEQLIATCTATLTGGITSFLLKVEQIVSMVGNSEKGICLREQPFASAEKVGEVVSSTQKNLRSQLPHMQRSMQLYLANRDTEFILFKPVRANVILAFGNLQAVVWQHYPEEEQPIVACPGQEELSALIASLFKA